MAKAKKETKAKTKRTGRPSGSRNKSRAVVQHVVPPCPGCGSTDRKCERIAIERESAGVVAEGPHAGFEFSHIIWRDKICNDCGQALREISYEKRAA